MFMCSFLLNAFKDMSFKQTFKVSMELMSRELRLENITDIVSAHMYYFVMLQICTCPISAISYHIGKMHPHKIE